MTCPGNISCASLEAWWNMIVFLLPVIGIAGFMIFHRMTDRNYTEIAEDYWNKEYLDYSNKPFIIKPGNTI